MIIVSVGYNLGFIAPATLPLRQGGVPHRGEGVDNKLYLSALIHPLRRYAPRPPVSGGQYAGAVIVFCVLFVTNSPPETGWSTPKGGGGG